MAVDPSDDGLTGFSEVVLTLNLRGLFGHVFSESSSGGNSEMRLLDLLLAGGAEAGQAFFAGTAASGSDDSLLETILLFLDVAELPSLILNFFVAKLVAASAFVIDFREVGVLFRLSWSWSPLKSDVRASVSDRMTCRRNRRSATDLRRFCLFMVAR